MGEYNHSVVEVNGRPIALNDIMNGTVKPQTSPEQSAFLFIREWIGGKDQFEIRTSGSTGPPKTILISRGQMIASAALTAQALGLDQKMTALLCLDARYIAGRMMIVRAFVTGMRLVIADPVADPLSNVLRNNVIDFTAVVPYQLMSVLESKHPHVLDRVQKVLVGGAPLGEAAIERLTSFSSEIYLTYGMTETVSHVALRRLNGREAQACFETLPGVSISADSRGCLVIDATFLNGPIVTNDLVEIINSRQFLWRGRYDHVINSGGLKISPEYLEQTIGKIFTRLNVRNHFFIHAIPDPKLGQCVVMVIDGPLPDASTLDQVVESILHSFPPHERPRQLFLSPSFVWTDTQKINRQETLAKATLIKAIHS